MRISSVMPIGILFTLYLNAAHAVVVNGKDWRRLTETVGVSWDAADAIYDTTTGLCDVPTCEIVDDTLGRIDFHGYIWASTRDVDEMLSAYTGRNLVSLSEANRYNGWQILNNYFVDFGAILIGRNEANSWGLTRNIGSGNGKHRFSVLDRTCEDPVCEAQGDYWHDYVALDPDYEFNLDNGVDRDTGIWLYSVVSIPGTLWLFLCALCGLSVFKRKH